MSELLYVPVLPVRQHARMAYERLRSDIQAAVAPLWNLPPSPGTTSAQLDNWASTARARAGQALRRAQSQRSFDPDEQALGIVPTGPHEFAYQWRAETVMGEQCVGFSTDSRG
ncbi:hypothetical protein SUDANB1_01946 [Streptomyces sp. enrichment culture]|uniref:beta family protein n=1 Tax=Streptomyces sp. enrichment culture TaxID=1795815 RepID=UPI003F54F1EC